MKKTALYDSHIKYDGKMVEYAGYSLPVQYSGIAAEHLAVRNAAGLFDVSHMGEFFVEGKNALKYIQSLFTNDFSNMIDNQVRYSPLCNDEGGIVDDLLVYRFNEERYMLVVNASNIEKDFKFIKTRIIEGVTLLNVSESYSQIALQGPLARAIMESLCSVDKIPKKKYHFTPDAIIAGIPCLLSTTGYTGEDGFEIYIENTYDANKVYEALIEAGKPFSLIPCGLGARDTLRLEAAMPLYSHEMDDNISPLETGLGFFVKMNKEDFIGKKALLEKGEPTVCRVGLILHGKGIARGGEKVFKEGKEIGFITSGTMNPVNKQSIAMAIVNKEQSETGNRTEVVVRTNTFEAEVVKLPFILK